MRTSLGIPVDPGSNPGGAILRFEFSLVFELISNATGKSQRDLFTTNPGGAIFILFQLLKRFLYFLSIFLLW